MVLTINTARERLELTAAAEVSKTMAFYALCILTRTIQGDQREIFSEIRDTLFSLFQKSKATFSEEEVLQFRDYAETAIRDLFRRIRIEGEQLFD